MVLEPGTRLGPYEVVTPLSAGAPGEIERYKASDTRINRLVALQVLPAELSDHPEIRERLERDTRTISALNHPNICGFLDVVHQQPGIDFLVTEFVEGETLAERLTRGRLEVLEALHIAIAIADSLDKAHHQGVTHGGLNPSAVLLTANGPKLVDFGVAKWKQHSRAHSSGSTATTLAAVPSLASAPAMSTAYMSPEQVAGEIGDARSDIFALGAMLYEMLTGKQAFREKTVALLIAAIQSVDPEPVNKLQPVVPVALDHLVKRCITKDPKKRLQTSWDLKAQLQWIAEGGEQAAATPSGATTKKHDKALWTVLGMLIIAGAVVAPAALSKLRNAPDVREARFIITGLPSNSTPITVSPDGRWLTAIVGGAAANGVIAVPLNSVTPQELIKDNNVTQPFWSPDGRSMAFFENGKLKKADISGGPAQNICEVMNPIGGGSWSRDGTILFSSDGVIYKVAANGGQPVAIAEPDKSKPESNIGPSVLPDGRHYVYLASGNESAIYLGSIDSKDRTRLFAADSKPAYAAPGYILFNRGITVFAQGFDPKKLVLTGEPIRIADNVPTIPAGPNANSRLNRTGAFAVSQTGVLAFKTNSNAQASTGGDEQRSLFWFDRSGGRSAAVGPAGMYAGIDMAPDGKRFLVHRHEGTGGDIWGYDVSQGRLQRLTFDAGQENESPIWSPDGKRIAFASKRNNKSGIYTKLADGTGTEELIVESEALKTPTSWSPDGNVIVYSQQGQAGDIWAVPVTGDKKPMPLLQSSANEVFGQISPDGKWLAYQSNETGRAEIYIKPFLNGPGQWQVSTDGGQFPRWRRDGKELYFVLAPNIMAAEIRVVGSSIQPGVPQILFPLASAPGVAAGHDSYQRYAVSADGKSFLISQPSSNANTGVSGGLADQIAAFADQGSSPSSNIPPFSVTVVLNWTQMLKKK